MILAHKIALDPTPEQAVYFARACGTARFAWNWALVEWQRQYKAGEKPSEGKLRKLLNSIKREQFPWMLEVTKAAPQQAIKNLGAAFQRFFAGQAKYPRFKKKGERDSFRAENGPGTLIVSGRRLKLPVVGWIKMREPLRFQGSLKSVTVSRVADRWFASITVEIERQAPIRENQAVVGVDLGVKALAALSDGSTFAGPKALSRYLKKLKRRSRSLSRKVKGSANRKKAKQAIARLHARITNIRQDALHKLTTGLARRFTLIGIEGLNVRGMMANDRLARAVADVGMHEFRRQLAYKAAMHGTAVVVADRWFPSSKTCSCCGSVRAEMPLSVREWMCDDCGAAHDRDHNAARNLEQFARASSARSHACGDRSSAVPTGSAQRSRSAKQEPSHGTLAHG